MAQKIKLFLDNFFILKRNVPIGFYLGIDFALTITGATGKELPDPKIDRSQFSSSDKGKWVSPAAKVPWSDWVIGREFW
jgi:hypothetical protein